MDGEDVGARGEVGDLGVPSVDDGLAGCDHLAVARHAEVGVGARKEVRAALADGGVGAGDVAQLAVVEVDVEIANKQGYINPVIIESTTSERGVGAVHIGNEVELTIMEKVAIIELKIF